MGNFAAGVRLMFRVWRDPDFARKVIDLERGAPAAPPPAAPRPEPPPKPPPARSEALTLLALLQREARFVDFIMEHIRDYSDAQIGAAVRDLHKNCAEVLNRTFALQPLSRAAEGAAIEVPRDFDPVEYHLAGNVSGQAPYRGTVRHHGWKATRVDLPAWSGTSGAALTVAPIEVEVA